MDRLQPDQLKEFLRERFGKSELHHLCFRMGIDYRRFKSELKSDLIQEFLEEIVKSDREEELCRLAEHLRPVFFENLTNKKADLHTTLLPGTTEGILRLNRVQLFNLLGDTFNFKQLSTIYKMVGLVLKVTKVYKIVYVLHNLIFYTEDNGMEKQLRQILANHIFNIFEIKPDEEKTNS
ncbi:MAG: hypothetical protein AAGD96_13750, partial [Chloroflexota bacterium]